MLTVILALLENDDDRALMEHYYEEYRQLLFKVAHDYLDDINQDEDCVQNALVGIIDSFQTFRSLNEETQRKYLSTVCKRCAYRLNEEHNRNKTESIGEEVDFEAIKAYDGIADEFKIPVIASVINCLDEKYREPIMMKYLEQCSTAEIAGALGISENLVYQRIRRGKEKLCRMLSEVE